MKLPKLGLCCLTSDKVISYKTITKTKFDSLDSNQKYSTLLSIYSSNLNMFGKAIIYCKNNAIPMYRVTSHLFPFYESVEAKKCFKECESLFNSVALLIKQHSIRVVIHPDQFVVLSSDSSDVIRSSTNELVHHASIFDLFGLECSPINLINIHGGKKGNKEVLVEVINNLPYNIKSRLTLENDEYSYGIKELMYVHEKTSVPILFDFHHSVVFNRFPTYQHRQLKEEFELAKTTWYKYPNFITTHISNGKDEFLDRKHSDYITYYPPCMCDEIWIEVESKQKEKSLFLLQKKLEYK